MALHEVDPEAAVQEFQDLKLAEGRIQNDVASVLAEDNADIFRDISHRIGEGKRREAIDKALDKWERETARIEEKAQKRAERERIQAEKREAKRVADAQKQDVDEDTEADKESQATTQTILDEAEATETKEATETVVEEPKPKKKAAKKKTTKKTAKDLKAEEVRRQEAAGKKMTKAEPKVPKGTAKNAAELARRWEDARTEGKSYNITKEESKLMGKDNKDFNTELDKYRKTPEYINKNIPRLAEKVAKNPNAMNDFTGGELSFIENNQKLFDDELAKIKKPEKTTTKPPKKTTKATTKVEAPTTTPPKTKAPKKAKVPDFSKIEKLNSELSGLIKSTLLVFITSYLTDFRTAIVYLNIPIVLLKYLELL